MAQTLTQSQFRSIVEIAKRRWGLHITDKKASLVESRLTKHLVRSHFSTITEYLDHLQGSPTEKELLEFFDLLSTNTTSFFREVQHFDYLRDVFYPALAQRSRERRLRIWSAACSNGSEPYSLIIHALEHLPESHKWDIKLLATDLSASALSGAREARYSPKTIEDLPPALVKKYFTRVPANDDRTMRVTQAVRDRVSIHQLNLMEDWPMRGPFDVIFLRNVMIYFDAEVRRRLVTRMLRLLDGDGVFVIGSAETLSGLDIELHTARPSVYTKREGHG